MQTQFTDAQRKDPAIRVSEEILRKCVHCGFCAATCPTYTLLGDELDSPRGRIYLIKDMLENDRPATGEVVRHVDRCLSCLACMTTCPSGVNYRHLIDHARVHIERTYRRPWADRWLRALLAAVMPYPRRFSMLLWFARLFRPFRRLLPRRLAAALALVPRKPAGAVVSAGVDQIEARAADPPAARVGVVTGCVQSVLGKSANEATVRLLRRIGCETVEIAGCCGSLTHHLGREADTRVFAAQFVEAVERASQDRPLDALVFNASGCGSHLKDLGFVFRDDGSLAEATARIGELSRDITELVAELGLPPVSGSRRLRVAYHSACSMQHGLKLHGPPRELLREAGFDVVEIPEAHLCCGSAGTYNMLQPEIAARLAQRKIDHIEALGVDLIAAGNLGCMTQLAAGTNLPVMHTVELLDWATGGPVPEVLVKFAG